MIHTHQFIAARIGAGLNASVIVKGQARVTGNWSPDILGIEITHAEVVKSEGDLHQFRQRLHDLTPEHDERGNTGPHSQLDVAIDITAAPAFGSLVQDANGYYTITTGASSSQNGLAHTVGRLVLFDALRTEMARRKVKFAKNREGWPDVEAALTEATARPPKNEQDGLALLETTLNDDISLAIALLVWRVINHTPMGTGEIDYSKVDQASVSGLW